MKILLFILSLVLIPSFVIAQDAEVKEVNTKASWTDTEQQIDVNFDESTIATVGVDFFIKQVIYENIGNCTLQLWDLGGQQRFRHLLESFIMGAKGGLLLFDLTKMPTINDILNWVNIIRMHDLDLPIILVGTKRDLEEAIAVDDESANSIKNAFNMIQFVKTSSKTGDSIDLVFDILVEELMKKRTF